jgi:hypothetical protein
LACRAGRAVETAQMLVSWTAVCDMRSVGIRPDSLSRPPSVLGFLRESDQQVQFGKVHRPEDLGRRRVLDRVAGTAHT